MANGTYLRGEVYWISLDDSIGSEEKTGRPAVIVSANGLNEKDERVVVAFLTKQSFALPYRPSIVDPTNKDVRSRVLCDQLRTVDKTRLTRYMWSLDDSELVRVTGALACTLCIPTPKPGVEAKSSPDNDVLSLRCEADMWRRMYEKVMDQLVEVKTANDLNRKISEPKEAPIVPSEPTEPVEPENTRAEINTCTVEDLVNCGCTTALARLIISYRPYKTVGDLTRVPGVKATAFQILKHKVCCTYTEEKPKIVEAPKPVERDPGYKVEKVNINTATAAELMEKLGICKHYAYMITGYRHKNGRFVELEELKEADRLPESFYEKYKDRITIGEDEPPRQQTSSKKVNVNTAKATEIKELLGCSANAAYAITGYRKKSGSISKLEELVKLPYWSEGMLAKHRDKLEV